QHFPYFKVSYQQQPYWVTANAIFPPRPRFSPAPRFYTIITPSQHHGEQLPSYALLLNIPVIGQNHSSLTLLLEDSCHDTYLPQRFYAYGSALHHPLPDEQSWWDNLYQDIYVDKFLVSFRDIVEWVEYGAGPPALIQQ